MTYKIVIIIPCYNEENRFSLEKICAHLSQTNRTRFLFVDDGSSDATLALLEKVQSKFPQRIDVLKLQENVGKAEAVRQGMRQALSYDSEFLGFLDADFSTPLSEMDRLFRVIDAEPGYLMACGARVRRLGAKINRRWYRHYFGRIIATGISIILKLPCYDTQCGAKIFRKKTAEQLFQHPFSSTWLFDVELFARMIGVHGRKKAGTCIVELPLLTWNDVGSSKVKLSYLPKIPLELMKIARKYRTQLARK